MSKEVFDVFDLVVPILNVASVTSTIDGDIWRIKRPQNRTVRDIVLVPLVLGDGHQDDIDVQEGIFFINIWALKLSEGMHDEPHLKATTDAVVAVIKAYSSGSTYFHIEIVNKTIFDDQDSKDMSYMSIRLKYTIET